MKTILQFTLPLWIAVQCFGHPLNGDDWLEKTSPEGQKSNVPNLEVSFTNFPAAIGALEEEEIVELEDNWYAGLGIAEDSIPLETRPFLVRGLMRFDIPSMPMTYLVGDDLVIESIHSSVIDDFGVLKRPIIVFLKRPPQSVYIVEKDMGW